MPADMEINITHLERAISIKAYVAEKEKGGDK